MSVSDINEIEQFLSNHLIGSGINSITTDTISTAPLRNILSGTDDFKEFVKLYNPENRLNREESWSEQNPDGRWRKNSYDEITNRDQTSMDIFWVKDDSLTDLDNLPDPDILAAEIVET